jgi:hypothetical protein
MWDFFIQSSYQIYLGMWFKSLQMLNYLTFKFAFNDYVSLFIVFQIIKITSFWYSNFFSTSATSDLEYRFYMINNINFFHIFITTIIVFTYVYV